MASLHPGTLLGAHQRYCVIKELNRGGTAVVYEAVDRHASQSVALKVMDGSASLAAASAVRAAQRELACAAALRDEHIVQLLDWFTDEVAGVGQLLVIVWELIKGMDLLDLLNAHSGRLKEETAAGYFLQLARGVAAIHAHGLCHRDLKPENCMVEAESGQLKIIDFGLSKRQQSAVTLGVGTPSYMPPELLGSGDVQLLRQRHTGSYDATACDCWSMGVLLYLLVVGDYPFDDPVHPQNVVITLQNIMAGRYRALPASISPACADLIRRLLTRDPATRIKLNDVLAHPFLTAAVDAEGQQAAVVQQQVEARVEKKPQETAAEQQELEQAAVMDVSHDSPTIPAGAATQERLPSFAFSAQPATMSHKATPQIITLKAVPATTVRAAAKPSPAQRTSPFALFLCFGWW